MDLVRNVQSPFGYCGTHKCGESNAKMLLIHMHHRRGREAVEIR